MRMNRDLAGSSWCLVLCAWCCISEGFCFRLVFLIYLGYLQYITNPPYQFHIRRYNTKVPDCTKLQQLELHVHTVPLLRVTTDSRITTHSSRYCQDDHDV